MVLWGLFVLVCQSEAMIMCVSGSGVESPTVVGESPVRESMCGVVEWVPRVAAGSWNLL